MRFGYGTNGFADHRLPDALDLAVVVETDARYLLDPRRKHAPTSLDDDRDRRVTFLRGAEQASRRQGEGRTA